MSYDPTKWESHAAAYQYWSAKKHEFELNVQIRKQQLAEKYGWNNPDFLNLIQRDYEYRASISDETWARTQAGYYCQQVILDKLSRVLSFLEKDE